MDDTETRKILTDFGYDEHAARLIASYAHRHDLTQADIENWIVEAQTSQTITNPLGFVRARIQGGDKLPSSRTAVSTHADRQRYLVTDACPKCGTYPCVCDWDPETEDLHDYRERKIREEKEQS